MKPNLFWVLLCIAAMLDSYGQNTLKTDSAKLQIVRFETHTGLVNSKDSIWDVTKPIRMSLQPTSVSITIKDNTDSLPNFECIAVELLKLNDTLRLDRSNTINLINLSGGDYELTFINLNNKHQTKINFSIAPVFWERWWFSPFIFLVISVILGLIFYAIYLIQLRSKLRLQALRHELEIKALRAQMNPHFIFNSMNTIDAYILRKRFVEASDCLQKFSKLIRQILENSENQTISIAKELEALKLYIELEQERFSHSFSYQLDVQPELLAKEYQLPPLLLQPFVENAILHGIRHLTDRKGEILVSLNSSSLNRGGAGATDASDEVNHRVLHCLIQDNGVGRTASLEINQERQSNHKSMGMNVTMERIRTYQAIYGDTMETTITDLAEGTKVEIKLPLIFN